MVEYMSRKTPVNWFDNSFCEHTLRISNFKMSVQFYDLRSYVLTYQVMSKELFCQIVNHFQKLCTTMFKCINWCCPTPCSTLLSATLEDFTQNFFLIVYKTSGLFLWNCTHDSYTLNNRVVATVFPFVNVCTSRYTWNHYC